MKTNSTKRNIAIATLALLAIGAGYIYTNSQRTLNNGNDNAVAMTTAPTAILAPAPVAPATPLISAGTADDACTASDDVYTGSKTTARRHKVTRKTSNTTTGTEDQYSLATTESFEGNMPVAATTTTVSSKTQSTDQPAAPATYVPQDNGKASRKGRINFAAEVGANLNGLYHNSTSNEFSNGFHGGVMANIALGTGNVIAFQPGVRYIMKGNIDKSTSTGMLPEINKPMEIGLTHTTRLHYVEAPLNVVYKFGDIVGNPRFMVGAGPYVSYLVAAENKYESTAKDDQGLVVSNTKSTTNGAGNMKKLDYGVGGFVGCQMPKGFYAKAGAELGLRDMGQDLTGKPMDRNYNLLISVGYIVGSKGKVY